jgi:hypothetical protein
MTWPVFGIRDLMLLLVVVAAVYLVVLLLRLVLSSRQRHALSRSENSTATAAKTQSPLRTRNTPDNADREPLIQVGQESANRKFSEDQVMGQTEKIAPKLVPVPPASPFQWDEVRELFGEEEELNLVHVGVRPQSVTPRGSPAISEEQHRGGFGEPLSAHLARSEVEMEVQRMRDEMERMRAEMEELRAVRHVSPHYADAVEMVQRGLSAQDVADQLGISLGEAELVLALSRGNQDFDRGEGNGTEVSATNGEFDEFDRFEFDGFNSGGNSGGFGRRRTG